jgi:hypothetical protein
MAIMGWSSAAMANRYQHQIDSVRLDVANQISGLLWEAPKDASEQGKSQARRRLDERPRYD